jgi:hypothetical protein
MVVVEFAIGMKELPSLGQLMCLSDERSSTHHVSAALTIDIRDADIFGNFRLPTRSNICW